ncbi:hypothetical protein GDO81_001734 [Engystomops pustulosus]|uniref:Meiotic recombination protein REC8 homolog n=1 Tax=Engystomops pustulosus TaxID=76066 RepID=A0AAV7DHN6_ENGPU|nr:hypothetical protein GDO81_001734 [Engystomops pustulosus]
MFYYPNVLQRHTGCFSTVWLAATKGSRIVKREYLKVNVMKTCHRIVQYILQQVPAPYHGSPIPRLSLYLSAQLSYGVVCVYHRQCDLLIEEMKTTLDRLFKAEKQTKIDLIHTEQHLLLPDNLILMQMSEDAPDPFFGMMEISPELPEPMMIPQTITIQEVEPVPLPSVEFGQDLPEVSPHDLELLVSDLPSLPEVETLPEPRKRHLLDATVLLDEVTGQPMDFLPGKVELMLPEEPFEGVHLPPARRSLQRSSLIVDKDTQIVSKTMQEQTCDPLIYTQSVVFDLMKSQTPASLFESPTYQTFMAPELLELWSRCALLEPLQFTQEREEELISEPEEMRAGTESGVSVMFSSEFSLEMSEEERSRPILLTPEDGRSLSGQEDKFLPMVSEMPEVIVELPETQEVLLSDMYRKLHSEIDSAGRAEFLSLTPGALSRFFASRFFFNCLVLCTQQVIRLEQTEPYGRILITPGSNY